MIRNSKLLVVFSLALVFISGISFAQQKEVTIGVYPPVFELELEKGESYQNQILLRNKSELAIPINTQIVNFTAVDETGGISFEEGDAPQKWFKVEKTDFILEPEGSERIKFKINIPENVQRGGYYGTILFKSKLPSHYFEEEATKTMPQIGVLFLISIGKRGEADFEIIEFGVPEESRIKILEKLSRNVLDSENIIIDSSRVPFTLRVKNNDIYHIKPSGELIITRNKRKTEDGREQFSAILGEVEIKETTILPGKIRQFPVEFQPALFESLDKFLPGFLAGFISENLFFGKYKVLLNLHGSAEIEKGIEVVIFPWKSIIILLFFCGVLFIIIKYTKRRKRKKIHETTQKEAIRKKKTLIDGIKKTTNN